MSKQFTWFKSYPDFVPQTVDENKYKSLAHVFEDVVKKYGSQVAFQNMDVTLTYNQLKARNIHLSKFAVGNVSYLNTFINSIGLSRIRMKLH